MKLKHIVCLIYTPDASANAVELNTSDKPRRLVPRTVFGSNLRPNNEHSNNFLNFFLSSKVNPGT
jgi:hypothetical protein